MKGEKMKPTQTIEMLGDLQAKMTQPNFKESLRYQIANVVEKQGWKNDKLKIANESVEYIGHNSKNLVPYLVKDEMTNLIVHASKMLDKDDVFDLDLLPSKEGFVEFEKPLEIYDVRGHLLLIHYFVWMSYQNTIVVLAFNDQYKNPDIIAQQAKLNNDKKWWDFYTTTVGRWGYVGLLKTDVGDTIGAEEIEYPDYVKQTYLENHGVEIGTSTNALRLFHTYLLLMNQTIVSVSKERAEKKDAKRLERAKLPSEITVVQFRKTKYTGSGSSSGKEIDWSHRWLVGGHWRWQPYKDNTKKRIWIAPYVKGPDDKPLVMKDKVYVLAK
jgi:hypothetical protein